jgi:hypothetical protein
MATSAFSGPNVNLNNLLGIYNGSNLFGTANTTPAMVPKTQTLPNGGGTYNPAGNSEITPNPFVVAPTAKVNTAKAPVFTGATPQANAPMAPAANTSSSLYDKYRDPKTGKVMTPEEYAIYLGSKVPKGNGEITNYAGDAMANPNQTAAELQGRATNLNNSRNDIATGTTDPYKVGNTSGIAYSPTELKAIENAYAGIYDPALNDVFARLKETQAAEKAKTDLETSKEERVFATNEAIRQWRATTGTTPAATGSGTKEKDLFTKTQLNHGASNAGLSVTAFDSLDDDIKNFYINAPMALNSEDKKVPMYQNFAEDFASVAAGDLSADQLVSDITASPIPEAVKHYFIDQIPAEPAKKEDWLSKVWGLITGK